MWSASIAASCGGVAATRAGAAPARGRPQRRKRTRAVRVGGGVRTKLRSRVVPASLAEDDLDAQGAYFALERSPCAPPSPSASRKATCASSATGTRRSTAKTTTRDPRMRRDATARADPCDATRTAPRHYPFALLPFPVPPLTRPSPPSSALRPQPRRSSLRFSASRRITRSSRVTSATPPSAPPSRRRSSARSPRTLTLLMTCPTWAARRPRTPTSAGAPLPRRGRSAAWAFAVR